MKRLSASGIIAAILLGLAVASGNAGNFDNPVSISRTNPDPWVYQGANGFYYGLSTHEHNNDIVMFRSTNLVALYQGKGKVVWQAPAVGWNTHDIWAPELHEIEGAFYIYYSGGNGARQSCGVLKCAGGDPYHDAWSDAGRLHSPAADDWAIDGTVLQQNGHLYFIWSDISPDNVKKQNLFISRMSSPTALTGPRVELSRPEFPFECHGDPKIIDAVNEGPEILQHNDQTFLVYSCSFCATRYYNLGCLSCNRQADPLVASNWTKSAVSIFKEGNGLYGPGHCSFTKSPSGREDWLVYHAMVSTNEYKRYVCMQKFTWNPDGTPNFGTPQKTGIANPE